MQTKGDGNLSVKDITVFKWWPEREAQKVPSKYSYSRTTTRRRQWGYSIDDKSQVMQWTKLDLVQRKPPQELDVLRGLLKGLDLVDRLRADENASVENEIPRHISKDSWEVMRDYLVQVSEEWHRHMKSQGKHILDRVPIDIVISYPAVGSSSIYWAL
jgi:hypothetical protein